MNILISEPGAADMSDRPFLPYMWSTLKSHWEHFGDGPGSLEWLAPIYRNTDVATAIRPYENQRIDVLGLSCYIWNWDLQQRIARQVKARNPDCVIIAGGPHPDYKDPNFFVDHPYIDAVAVKDGEITFANILRRVTNGMRDFSEVRGLYLPNPGEKHVFTGPAEVPMKFEYSPYIEQSGYYEQLSRQHEGKLSAVWETNRGCPYTCSYCDWGSNTMSKLRLFDMARVQEEIEWIARMNIWLVFLTDANLGILARDTEVADLICHAREQYGYPKYLAYSNAKNNPDRSVAISRKLHASGLMMQYDLSIQHTDREVLAATARSNISPDKQIAVANELRKDGVPIEVQLIVGIPGDTYEKWKGCLTDLMERGVDGTYLTFPYQLLPNAPAANPDFLEKWAVGTIDRYAMTTSSRKGERLDPEKVTRAKYVVESSTYSRADWVKMQTFSAFVKALHTSSLTQQIARYLRLTHGIGYGSFYDAVIEDYCAQAEPSASRYRQIAARYENWLQDPEATEFMEIAELPGYQNLLHPAHWLYVQICRDSDSFFHGLHRFLAAKYPGVANLSSMVDYQRQLVIMPGYQRSKGMSFRTNLDWVEYFARATAGDLPDKLDEPQSVPGAIVRVSDLTSSNDLHAQPLNWDEQ